MFLAGDTPEQRERLIRQLLEHWPGLAVVAAAVNFEWTVSRAVLFLSKTSNSELRSKLKHYHGLWAYARLWDQEVRAYRDVPTLPTIVPDWTALNAAFQMRHELVHGRERCTRNMALPKIDTMVDATKSIHISCLQAGFNLSSWMPVRKKSAAQLSPGSARTRASRG
jgi:hypothetical protein